MGLGLGGVEGSFGEGRGCRRCRDGVDRRAIRTYPLGSNDLTVVMILRRISENIACAFIEMIKSDRIVVGLEAKLRGKVFVYRTLLEMRSSSMSPSKAYFLVGSEAPNFAGPIFVGPESGDEVISVGRPTAFHLYAPATIFRQKSKRYAVVDLAEWDILNPHTCLAAWNKMIRLAARSIEYQRLCRHQ